MRTILLLDRIEMTVGLLCGKGDRAAVVMTIAGVELGRRYSLEAFGGHS